MASGEKPLRNRASTAPRLSSSEPSNDDAFLLLPLPLPVLLDGERREGEATVGRVERTGVGRRGGGGGAGTRALPSGAGLAAGGLAQAGSCHCAGLIAAPLGRLVAGLVAGLGGAACAFFHAGSHLVAPALLLGMGRAFAILEVAAFGGAVAQAGSCHWPAAAGLL